MQQIHLGRRLDENIVFSQRTYLLDTKTTVSALEDIIGVQLNLEGLKRRMELLAVTAQKAVDPQAAMKIKLRLSVIPDRRSKCYYVITGTLH